MSKMSKGNACETSAPMSTLLVPLTPLITTNLCPEEGSSLAKGTTSTTTTTTTKAIRDTSRNSDSGKSSSCSPTLLDCSFDSGIAGVLLDANDMQRHKRIQQCKRILLALERDREHFCSIRNRLSKISERKKKKLVDTEFLCNVCCAEIDPENAKTFVKCFICQKYICRSIKCADWLAKTAQWECELCQTSKESLAQTSSWVADQLSFNQQKLVYPMRARSEIFIPISECNDSSIHFESVSQIGANAALITAEQRLKIREYVEEIVSHLLGGNLDTISVNQLSKSENYLPAPKTNGHHYPNGSVVSRHQNGGIIGAALDSRDSTPGPDFTDVSEARLRNMIQKIIAETVNMAPLTKSYAVSEIALDRPSKLTENMGYATNGLRHRTEHYFEPTIYQDLLATAVLNKIVDKQSNNNNRNMSESSPDLTRRGEVEADLGDGVSASLDQNYNIENQSITSGSSVEPRSECSYTDTEPIVTTNDDKSSEFILDAGRDSALSDYIAAHMVPLPNLTTIPTESEEDDYMSVTSSAVGDSNWENNWLFKKKKSTVSSSLGGSSVGMLVPDPKEDVRAQIGDKTADEISDLSELGSDTDDSSLDLLRSKVDPINDRLFNKHLIGGQNSKLVLDELIERSSMISNTLPPDHEQLYTETRNENVEAPNRTEAINSSVTQQTNNNNEEDHKNLEAIMPPVDFDDPSSNPLTAGDGFSSDSEGCVGFGQIEVIDPTKGTPSVIEILAAMALGPMIAIPAADEPAALTTNELTTLTELRDLALTEIKIRSLELTSHSLGVIPEEMGETDGTNFVTSDEMKIEELNSPEATEVNLLPADVAQEEVIELKDVEPIIPSEYELGKRDTQEEKLETAVDQEILRPISATLEMSAEKIVEQQNATSHVVESAATVESNSSCPTKQVTDTEPVINDIISTNMSVLETDSISVEVLDQDVPENSADMPEESVESEATAELQQNVTTEVQCETTEEIPVAVQPEQNIIVTAAAIVTNVNVSEEATTSDQEIPAVNSDIESVVSQADPEKPESTEPNVTGQMTTIATATQPISEPSNSKTHQESVLCPAEQVTSETNTQVPDEVASSNVADTAIQPTADETNINITVINASVEICERQDQESVPTTTTIKTTEIFEPNQEDVTTGTTSEMVSMTDLSSERIDVVSIHTDPSPQKTSEILLTTDLSPERPLETESTTDTSPETKSEIVKVPLPECEADKEHTEQETQEENTKSDATELSTPLALSVSSETLQSEPTEEATNTKATEEPESTEEKTTTPEMSVDAIQTPMNENVSESEHPSITHLGEIISTEILAEPVNEDDTKAPGTVPVSIDDAQTISSTTVHTRLESDDTSLISELSHVPPSRDVPTDVSLEPRPPVDEDTTVGFTPPPPLESSAEGLSDISKLTNDIEESTNDTVPITVESRLNTEAVDEIPQPPIDVHSTETILEAAEQTNEPSEDIPETMASPPEEPPTETILPSPLEICVETCFTLQQHSETCSELMAKSSAQISIPPPDLSKADTMQNNLSANTKESTKDVTDPTQNSMDIKESPSDSPINIEFLPPPPSNNFEDSQLTTAEYIETLPPPPLQCITDSKLLSAETTSGDKETLPPSPLQCIGDSILTSGETKMEDIETSPPPPLQGIGDSILLKAEIAEPILSSVELSVNAIKTTPDSAMICSNDCPLHANIANTEALLPSPGETSQDSLLTITKCDIGPITPSPVGIIDKTEPSVELTKIMATPVVELITPTATESALIVADIIPQSPDTPIKESPPSGELSFNDKATVTLSSVGQSLEVTESTTHKGESSVDILLQAENSSIQLNPLSPAETSSNSGITAAVQVVTESEVLSGTSHDEPSELCGAPCAEASEDSPLLATELVSDAIAATPTTAEASAANALEINDSAIKNIVEMQKAVESLEESASIQDAQKSLKIEAEVALQDIKPTGIIELLSEVVSEVPETQLLNPDISTDLLPPESPIVSEATFSTEIPVSTQVPQLPEITSKTELCSSEASLKSEILALPSYELSEESTNETAHDGESKSLLAPLPTLIEESVEISVSRVSIMTPDETGTVIIMSDSISPGDETVSKESIPTLAPEPVSIKDMCAKDPVTSSDAIDISTNDVETEAQTIAISAETPIADSLILNVESGCEPPEDKITLMITGDNKALVSIAAFSDKTQKIEESLDSETPQHEVYSLLENSDVAVREIQSISPAETETSVNPDAAAQPVGIPAEESVKLTCVDIKTIHTSPEEDESETESIFLTPPQVFSSVSDNLEVYSVLEGLESVEPIAESVESAADIELSCIADNAVYQILVVSYHEQAPETEVSPISQPAKEFTEVLSKTVVENEPTKVEAPAPSNDVVKPVVSTNVVEISKEPIETNNVTVINSGDSTSMKLITELEANALKLLATSSVPETDTVKQHVNLNSQSELANTDVVVAPVSMQVPSDEIKSSLTNTEAATTSAELVCDSKESSEDLTQVKLDQVNATAAAEETAAEPNNAVSLSITELATAEKMFSGQTDPIVVIQNSPTVLEADIERNKDTFSATKDRDCTATDARATVVADLPSKEVSFSILANEPVPQCAELPDTDITDEVREPIAGIQAASSRATDETPASEVIAAPVFLAETHSSNAALEETTSFAPNLDANISTTESTSSAAGTVVAVEPPSSEVVESVTHHKEVVGATEKLETQIASSTVTEALSPKTSNIREIVSNDIIPPPAQFSFDESSEIYTINLDPYTTSDTTGTNNNKVLEEIMVNSVESAADICVDPEILSAINSTCSDSIAPDDVKEISDNLTIERITTANVTDITEPTVVSETTDTLIEANADPSTPVLESLSTTTATFTVSDTDMAANVSTYSDLISTVLPADLSGNSTAENNKVAHTETIESLESSTLVELKVPILSAAIESNAALETSSPIAESSTVIHGTSTSTEATTEPDAAELKSSTQEVTEEVPVPVSEEPLSSEIILGNGQIYLAVEQAFQQQTSSVMGDNLAVATVTETPPNAIEIPATQSEVAEMQSTPPAVTTVESSEAVDVSEDSTGIREIIVEKGESAAQETFSKVVDATAEAAIKESSTNAITVLETQDETAESESSSSKLTKELPSAEVDPNGQVLMTQYTTVTIKTQSSEIPEEKEQTEQTSITIPSSIPELTEESAALKEISETAPGLEDTTGAIESLSSENIAENEKHNIAEQPIAQETPAISVIEIPITIKTGSEIQPEAAALQSLTSEVTGKSAAPKEDSCQNVPGSDDTTGVIEPLSSEIIEKQKQTEEQPGVQQTFPIEADETTEAIITEAPTNVTLTEAAEIGSSTSEVTEESPVTKEESWETVPRSDDINGTIEPLSSEIIEGKEQTVDQPSAQQMILIVAGDTKDSTITESPTNATQPEAVEIKSSISEVTEGSPVANEESCETVRGSEDTNTTIEPLSSEIIEGKIEEQATGQQTLSSAAGDSMESTLTEPATNATQSEAAEIKSLTSEVTEGSPAAKEVSCETVRESDDTNTTIEPLSSEIIEGKIEEHTTGQQTLSSAAGDSMESTLTEPATNATQSEAAEIKSLTSEVTERSPVANEESCETVRGSEDTNTTIEPLSSEIIEGKIEEHTTGQQTLSSAAGDSMESTLTEPATNATQSEAAEIKSLTSEVTEGSPAAKEMSCETARESDDTNNSIEPLSSEITEAKEQTEEQATAQQTLSSASGDSIESTLTEPATNATQADSTEMMSLNSQVTEESPAAKEDACASVPRSDDTTGTIEQLSSDIIMREKDQTNLAEEQTASPQTISILADGNTEATNTGPGHEDQPSSIDTFSSEITVEIKQTDLTGKSGANVNDSVSKISDPADEAGDTSASADFVSSVSDIELAVTTATNEVSATNESQISDETSQQSKMPMAGPETSYAEALWTVNTAADISIESPTMVTVSEGVPKDIEDPTGTIEPLEPLPTVKVEHIELPKESPAVQEKSSNIADDRAKATITESPNKVITESETQVEATNIHTSNPELNVATVVCSDDPLSVSEDAADKIQPLSSEIAGEKENTDLSGTQEIPSTIEPKNTITATEAQPEIVKVKSSTQDLNVEAAVTDLVQADPANIIEPLSSQIPGDIAQTVALTNLSEYADTTINISTSLEADGASESQRKEFKETTAKSISSSTEATCTDAEPPKDAQETVPNTAADIITESGTSELPEKLITSAESEAKATLADVTAESPAAEETSSIVADAIITEDQIVVSDTQLNTENTKSTKPELTEELSAADQVRSDDTTGKLYSEIEVNVEKTNLTEDSNSAHEKSSIIGDGIVVISCTPEFANELLAAETAPLSVGPQKENSAESNITDPPTNVITILETQLEVADTKTCTPELAVESSLADIVSVSEDTVRRIDPSPSEAEKTDLIGEPETFEALMSEVIVTPETSNSTHVPPSTTSTNEVAPTNDSIKSGEVLDSEHGEINEPLVESKSKSEDESLESKLIKPEDASTDLTIEIQAQLPKFSASFSVSSKVVTELTPPEITSELSVDNKDFTKPETIASLAPLESLTTPEQMMNPYSENADTKVTAIPNSNVSQTIIASETVSTSSQVIAEEPAPYTNESHAKGGPKTEIETQDNPGCVIDATTTQASSKETILTNSDQDTATIPAADDAASESVNISSVSTIVSANDPDLASAKISPESSTVEPAIESVQNPTESFAEICADSIATEISVEPTTETVSQSTESPTTTTTPATVLQDSTDTSVDSMPENKIKSDVSTSSEALAAMANVTVEDTVENKNLHSELAAKILPKSLETSTDVTAISENPESSTGIPIESATPSTKIQEHAADLATISTGSSTELPKHLELPPELQPSASDSVSVEQTAAISSEVSFETLPTLIPNAAKTAATNPTAESPPMSSEPTTEITANISPELSSPSIHPTISGVNIVEVSAIPPADAGASAEISRQANAEVPEASELTTEVSSEVTTSNLAQNCSSESSVAMELPLSALSDGNVAAPTTSTDIPQNVEPIKPNSNPEVHACPVQNSVTEENIAQPNIQETITPTELSVITETVHVISTLEDSVVSAAEPIGEQLNPEATTDCEVLPQTEVIAATVPSTQLKDQVSHGSDASTVPKITSECEQILEMPTDVSVILSIEPTTSISEHPTPAAEQLSAVDTIPVADANEVLEVADRSEVLEPTSNIEPLKKPTTKDSVHSLETVQISPPPETHYEPTTNVSEYSPMTSKLTSTTDEKLVCVTDSTSELPQEPATVFSNLPQSAEEVTPCTTEQEPLPEEVPDNDENNLTESSIHLATEESIPPVLEILPGCLSLAEELAAATKASSAESPLPTLDTKSTEKNLPTTELTSEIAVVDASAIEPTIKVIPANIIIAPVPAEVFNKTFEPEESQTCLTSIAAGTESTSLLNEPEISAEPVTETIPIETSIAVTDPILSQEYSESSASQQTDIKPPTEIPINVVTITTLGKSSTPVPVLNIAEVTEHSASNKTDIIPPTKTPITVVTLTTLGEISTPVPVSNISGTESNSLLNEPEIPTDLRTANTSAVSNEIEDRTATMEPLSSDIKAKIEQTEWTKEFPAAQPTSSNIADDSAEATITESPNKVITETDTQPEAANTNTLATEVKVTTAVVSAESIPVPVEEISTPGEILDQVPNISGTELNSRLNESEISKGLCTAHTAEVSNETEDPTGTIEPSSSEITLKVEQTELPEELPAAQEAFSNNTDDFVEATMTESPNKLVTESETQPEAANICSSTPEANVATAVGSGETVSVSEDEISSIVPVPHVSETQSNSLLNEPEIPTDLSTGNTAEVTNQTKDATGTIEPSSSEITLNIEQTELPRELSTAEATSSTITDDSVEATITELPNNLIAETDTQPEAANTNTSTTEVNAATAVVSAESVPVHEEEISTPGEILDPVPNVAGSELNSLLNESEISKDICTVNTAEASNETEDPTGTLEPSSSEITLKVVRTELPEELPAVQQTFSNNTDDFVEATMTESPNKLVTESETQPEAANICSSTPEANVATTVGSGETVPVSEDEISTLGEISTIVPVPHVSETQSNSLLNEPEIPTDLCTTNTTEVSNESEDATGTIEPSSSEITLNVEQIELPEELTAAKETLSDIENDSDEATMTESPNKFVIESETQPDICSSTPEVKVETVVGSGESVPVSEGEISTTGEISTIVPAPHVTETQSNSLINEPEMPTDLSTAHTGEVSNETEDPTGTIELSSSEITLNVEQTELPEELTPTKVTLSNIANDFVEATMTESPNKLVTESETQPEAPNICSSTSEVNVATAVGSGETVPVSEDEISTPGEISTIVPVSHVSETQSKYLLNEPEIPTDLCTVITAAVSDETEYPTTTIEPSFSGITLKVEQTELPKELSAAEATASTIADDCVEATITELPNNLITEITTQPEVATALISAESIPVHEEEISTPGEILDAIPNVSGTESNSLLNEPEISTDLCTVNTAAISNKIEDPTSTISSNRTVKVKQTELPKELSSTQEITSNLADDSAEVKEAIAVVSVETVNVPQNQMSTPSEISGTESVSLLNESEISTELMNETVLTQSPKPDIVPNAPEEVTASRASQQSVFNPPAETPVHVVNITTLGAGSPIVPALNVSGQVTESSVSQKNNSKPPTEIPSTVVDISPSEPDNGKDIIAQDAQNIIVETESVVFQPEQEESIDLSVSVDDESPNILTNQSTLIEVENPNEVTDSTTETKSASGITDETTVQPLGNHSNLRKLKRQYGLEYTTPSFEDASPQQSSSTSPPPTTPRNSTNSLAALCQNYIYDKQLLAALESRRRQTLLMHRFLSTIDSFHSSDGDCVEDTDTHNEVLLHPITKKRAQVVVPPASVSESCSSTTCSSSSPSITPPPVDKQQSRHDHSSSDCEDCSSDSHSFKVNERYKISYNFINKILFSDQISPNNTSHSDDSSRVNTIEEIVEYDQDTNTDDEKDFIVDKKNMKKSRRTTTISTNSTSTSTTNNIAATFSDKLTRVSNVKDNTSATSSHKRTNPRNLTNTTTNNKDMSRALASSLERTKQHSGTCVASNHVAQHVANGYVASKDIGEYDYDDNDVLQNESEEDDELGNLRRFVPGSIAEREYKKWYNAVEMPNNPYAPEALKRRISGGQERFIDLPNINPSTEQCPLDMINKDKLDIDESDKRESEFRRYSRDYYINDGSKSPQVMSMDQDTSKDATETTEQQLEPEHSSSPVSPHKTQTETATETVLDLYTAIPARVVEDTASSLDTMSQQSMQSTSTTSDDSDTIKIYNFKKQETTVIKDTKEKPNEQNSGVEEVTATQPSVATTKERPSALSLNRTENVPGAVKATTPSRGPTPVAFKFLQPKRKLLDPSVVLSVDEDEPQIPTGSTEKPVIEKEVVKALPSVKALAKAFLMTSSSVQYSSKKITWPRKSKTLPEGEKTPSKPVSFLEPASTAEDKSEEDATIASDLSSLETDSLSVPKLHVENTKDQTPQSSSPATTPPTETTASTVGTPGSPVPLRQGVLKSNIAFFENLKNFK